MYFIFQIFYCFIWQIYESITTIKCLLHFFFIFFYFEDTMCVSCARCSVCRASPSPPLLLPGRTSGERSGRESASQQPSAQLHRAVSSGTQPGESRRPRVGKSRGRERTPAVPLIVPLLLADPPHCLVSRAFSRWAEVRRWGLMGGAGFSPLPNCLIAATWIGEPNPTFFFFFEGALTGKRAR